MASLLRYKSDGVVALSCEVEPKPIHPRRPHAAAGEIIYFSKGSLLCCGGTGLLELLPDGDKVVKTPTPDPYFPGIAADCRRNMRIEAQVYEKIGRHPRIPELVSWDPDTCSLTMEYLENGNLREYIRRNHKAIEPRLRMQWAIQAAEGVSVLHTVDAVHCDLCPRNFLLDSDLNLKISDFGGSSLRGAEPSAVPQTRFRAPSYDFDAIPGYSDDIFSLGSLIYFIMTSSYPYEEKPSDEVDRLYEVQTFPDVSQLDCGRVISQCWNGQVDSAHAVYQSLRDIKQREYNS